MMAKYAEKTIIVVDGMGGGIGVQLVSKLRDSLGDDVEIIALGTNAVAVERMVKAGARRGAAGENAICYSVNTGSLIIGPIGIIIGNSMMGEITCPMAEAILAAPGERILLPLQNDHLTLAGLEGLPLSKMIERAVELAKERLERT
ncbi:MAG: DUF3842 family protein [Spirochaetaceae bacterium]|jgi:uncharacterized membrane protein|nr:DUF3842 family protein [Spirochaetaceae bacterium]